MNNYTFVLLLLATVISLNSIETTNAMLTKAMEAIGLGGFIRKYKNSEQKPHLSLPHPHMQQNHDRVEPNVQKNLEEVFDDRTLTVWVGPTGAQDGCEGVEVDLSSIKCIKPGRYVFGKELSGDIEGVCKISISNYNGFESSTCKIPFTHQGKEYVVFGLKRDAEKEKRGEVAYFTMGEHHQPINNEWKQKQLLQFASETELKERFRPSANFQPSATDIAKLYKYRYHALPNPNRVEPIVQNKFEGVPDKGKLTVWIGQTGTKNGCEGILADHSSVKCNPGRNIIGIEFSGDVEGVCKMTIANYNDLDTAECTIPFTHHRKKYVVEGLKRNAEKVGEIAYFIVGEHLKGGHKKALVKFATEEKLKEIFKSSSKQ